MQIADECYAVAVERCGQSAIFEVYPSHDQIGTGLGESDHQHTECRHRQGNGNGAYNRIATRDQQTEIQHHAGRDDYQIERSDPHGYIGETLRVIE